MPTTPIPASPLTLRQQAALTILGSLLGRSPKAELGTAARKALIIDAVVLADELLSRLEGRAE